MAKKNDTDKLSELLASFNGDLLKEDAPQYFNDDSIRVERILLDMVRPDPIQPRRVLPEKIHLAFHENRLTPSQALREMVQVAQVAARQRGRPFSNLLELLPDPEREDEGDVKHTPEEELLRELVNLAVTIRNDGQVNPITVIDVTEGVTRLYRIETGERRYWSAWLLRDFLPGYEGDGMIDCIVVPADRSSVFRQAKENTARKGLSAIAMARQAALLLLTVNGYEIPAYAVNNDFYRQALELRIPRGTGEAIYSAMGGIDKRRFSQYKDLLKLGDEALELADRHNLDERTLRQIASLSYEDQVEMLQQIIQFDLTSRQVEAIVTQGIQETDKPSTDDLPSFATKFAKTFIRDVDKFNADLLWTAVFREQGDPHMTSAYLKRLAQMALSAANRYSDEG
ncbi:ParB N-terminal domain-containing protein [Phototrophicus methaneseepsis]|uniref:ParB N-terminal domain-containing protein n=1 Tax=Phototrophicus methaneseepsis TaxID=2710758 RepID=A0A7S8IEW9_9CHLR|nr:ParB/RepB/Spo0J family partition protein [Phototrophicus methaneseepsis]QPC83026.1 ParB N-terminal domain-containing protein [Phototrophicus methaneseepsis]